MADIINSVGIDIGTSTTQLIFSRLVIENRASSYTVPRIDIVDKQVTYRSAIYFTPLLSADEIDAAAVKEIVRSEYQKAKMSPDMVQSGAVIITGETARKQNANQVLNALSEWAGDFVVATAGPDLESVLSARGAGTDTMSEEHRTVMANLDIGGGTTNIAAYNKGTLIGVTCLDIGGRLIKIENGKISYVFHKIKKLADDIGVRLEVGAAANAAALCRVTDKMAEILAESIGLAPKTGLSDGMYTNDGKPLPEHPPITELTLSGGVADCFYNAAGHSANDVFKYGDVGVLLGDSIRANRSFSSVNILHPAETIRATVVGAGIHTTQISGSTISFPDGVLPIKNIPILRISEPDEESSDTIISSIRAQLPLYMTDGRQEQVAISFAGWDKGTFDALQKLADALVKGAEEVIKGPFPLIFIIENDIGKALGHTLNVKLDHNKYVICIDGVRALNGDYIDIGEPVCGGHVLPVVIKTLIFNS
ncbi:MAG: ethanolamine ammonia-lyase reactivating factor EutA [Synergistaceae bacterium]|nr:ethanolamine ammonia-lyase reactivating factor EutA [Synergistaceae bacterium]